MVSIFVVMALIWSIECCFRCSTTRYRPRLVFALNAIFVAPLTMGPFLTYCQFGAIRDYCFGDAKFIATKRSPSSDKLSGLGSNGSLQNVGSTGALNGNGSKDKIADAGKPNGGLAAPLLGSKDKGGMLPI